MRVKTYSCNTSFLDLLFNMLLAFTCLFVLAFAMMAVKQQESKATYEAHAEFMVTTTWTEGMNDDIDTYVADPAGHLIMFQRRDDGLMHLDRDDRGSDYDFIDTPSGRIQCKDNREIVTIRGIVPGEYVVNVHAFSLRAKDKEGVSRPVRVRVEKINPYQLVCDKEVSVNKNGDERTIIRFEIDNEGKVTKTSDLPRQLANPSWHQH